eukprot:3116633-Amphidinium_carterae.3
MEQRAREGGMSASIEACCMSQGAACSCQGVNRSWQGIPVLDLMGESLIHPVSLACLCSSFVHD